MAHSLTTINSNVFFFCFAYCSSSPSPWPFSSEINVLCFCCCFLLCFCYSMRSGGYIRVNWTDTHFNKRLYRAVGTLGGCWRMLLLLLLLLHRVSVPYLWFTGFRLSSIKSQPPEVNGGAPVKRWWRTFPPASPKWKLKVVSFVSCSVVVRFGWCYSSNCW